MTKESSPDDDDTYRKHKYATVTEVVRRKGADQVAVIWVYSVALV